MVPLLTVGQLVAVNDTLAEIPGPLPTLTVVLPVHPLASVKLTVWLPEETPVNVLDACDGPPSNEYVYGAVPVVGVAVMVPLSTPGQDVAVNVAVPETPEPTVMVTVLVPVQLLASLIFTTCAPDARPVNTLLLPHGPPSI